jgi:hypothetical protein
MAARSIKNARIVPKGDWRGRQSGPSPFPLLVLVVIIALIFLVRLRADEKAEPFAMRTALPEMAQ